MAAMQTLTPGVTDPYIGRGPRMAGLARPESTPPVVDWLSNSTVPVMRKMATGAYPYDEMLRMGMLAFIRVTRNPVSGRAIYRDNYLTHTNNIYNLPMTNYGVLSMHFDENRNPLPENKLPSMEEILTNFRYDGIIINEDGAEKRNMNMIKTNNAFAGHTSSVLNVWGAELNSTDTLWLLLTKVPGFKLLESSTHGGYVVDPVGKGVEPLHPRQDGEYYQFMPFVRRDHSKTPQVQDFVYESPYTGLKDISKAIPVAKCLYNEPSSPIAPIDAMTNVVRMANCNTMEVFVHARA